MSDLIRQEYCVSELQCPVEAWSAQWHIQTPGSWSVKSAAVRLPGGPAVSPGLTQKQLWNVNGRLTGRTLSAEAAALSAYPNPFQTQRLPKGAKTKIKGHFFSEGGHILVSLYFPLLILLLSRAEREKKKLLTKNSSIPHHQRGCWESFAYSHGEQRKIKHSHFIFQRNI